MLKEHCKNQSNYWTDDFCTTVLL